MSHRFYVPFILRFNFFFNLNCYYRPKKPRTKILFYIVKHGPNNTKVVKLMNQKGRRRREMDAAEVFHNLYIYHDSLKNVLRSSQRVKRKLTN